MDPDRRVALEEERDFLLRSIRDLDAELAAGDLDEDDHRTLTADYTARAADVLRALETGDDEAAGRAGEAEADAEPDDAPSALARRSLVVGGVVAFAVLAGVLVMQSSGERGSGGLTGLDVSAASARLDDCQSMDQQGDADDALECYSEVLEAVPGNAVVLAGRGWLQVREFDLEDGLDDLDAAVQLDPDATGARIFRAIARERAGDPAGSIADLAAFRAADPPPEEVELAERLFDPPVSEAMDECIAGEVSGELPVAEAASCYFDVLAVDPGNARASVYLGFVLARSGRIDEAARLLDAGLEADPTSSPGYVFRAALRAHVGDVDGALADLDAVADLEPPEDVRERADELRAVIEAGEDPFETR